jgi:hypothetical protein
MNRRRALTEMMDKIDAKDGINIIDRMLSMSSSGSVRARQGVSSSAAGGILPDKSTDVTNSVTTDVTDSADTGAQRDRDIR